jgi:hypothetical protein
MVLMGSVVALFLWRPNMDQNRKFAEMNGDGGKEMSEQGQFEEYLGDGVYVDYDGYQIVLTANDRASGCPTDEVYLDPDVLNAFLRYINRLREMKP